ncbi:MAG: endonuclease domain-containing protein [bacterium]|nr:endonuclease domain-containing protein [bacterium]
MEKLFNRKLQKSVRQKLRNTMTSGEQRLWAKLRARQLDGYKFRRQQGIGPYIVDFYCPDQSLVIEVDGDTHYDEVGKQHDAIRDACMKDRGICILRFTNKDIDDTIDGVLEKIVEVLQTPSDSPL